MKLSTLTAIIATVVGFSMSHAIAADDHKGHDHGDKGKEHAHDAKPMYGGIVSVVKDVNYELVVKPDAITLYINDHGKPVDTKNAAATLTLLSVSDKTEVKLALAGENKLQANGSFKIQPGTKAAGSVKVDGKTQNVKFTLK